VSRPSTPIVAIVGRANVGKSSLYNAILGRREAVTAKEAGTTRDSISTRLALGDREFWLVDTAGLKTAADDFEASIQQQVTQAAESADVIWVVVDASGGIDVNDRRVAKLALKTKKPVILVVNKADRPGVWDLDNWKKLGIKQIIATSATQKAGLGELLESTLPILPNLRAKQTANHIAVAIVGRPNVGKSALFNTLGSKQQALVSERAGTTRDVNRLAINYHGHSIEFADTAGIRRSGKIDRGVEQFSVLRSLLAIEQSQIAILVVSAEELNVALDQKIAGLVKTAGRGLIIVVNKWDLSEEYGLSRSVATATLASNFTFTPWASLVFVSATLGTNVAKIYELVVDIAKTQSQRIDEDRLNEWLQAAVTKHPPAGQGRFQPTLKNMVQESDQASPSFQITGHHATKIHFSYKRYLERSFRFRWPFEGTPIKFWLIDNGSKKRRSTGHRNQP